MPMKSYADFESWANDQTEAQQKIIKAVRSFIRKEAKDLKETVKWGNGCYVGQNPIIYLYAGPEELQFGFFNGSSLDDPKERLEGKGAYIRHVKLKSATALDKPYMKGLIQEAIKLDEEYESKAKPVKTSSSKPHWTDGLSNPAKRALQNAGITTLKKLSQNSRADVLALHGLGPKAIPVLEKALKKEKLTFKR